jgi:hypothetical protein
MTDKFINKLHEMKGKYFPEESSSRVTTNQILEGIMGNIGRGINQFAAAGKAFKDKTKSGDMIGAVGDVVQGLGNVGKNQGDIDLENRIKSSWERMTSAQQAQWADVNQELEQQANSDPKYRHWKGLKGYQRYYAEQQIASKPGFQKGQMGIQTTVNQQQGRPGSGDQAKWDQWVATQWSKMDSTDKQLYGNDMNKYGDIEKSRAKRHNTQ